MRRHFYLTLAFCCIANQARSAELPSGSPATNFKFVSITSLAIDSKDNIFFSDRELNAIFKVTKAGELSVFAGTGKKDCTGDGGPATAADIAFPERIALDTVGNLYFTCKPPKSRYVIRKIDSRGIVTLFAGGGTTSILKSNFNATDAELIHPSGLACDKEGNVYFPELSQGIVRKVTPKGVISTFYNGFSNKAKVKLDFPSGITTDRNSNIVVGSTGRGAMYVVKITPDGNPTVIAGTGDSGYSGDGGNALKAKLFDPYSYAYDRQGNLFIADTLNYRIRKLEPGGLISSVVGNPPKDKGGGFSGMYGGDGKKASECPIFGPSDVAFDSAGTLYFADSSQIRVVENGVLRTIIGHQY